MKLALTFCACILLCANAASAEAPAMLPDMLGAEALPHGPDRGIIDWQIDASGAVRIATVACPQCRNPIPRRREFPTDPAIFARIAVLLPPGMIERALVAPCTLPHAQAGWLHRLELIERRANVETHHATFRECRSPELDELNARLAQAATILLELAPKPDSESQVP